MFTSRGSYDELPPWRKAIEILVRVFLIGLILFLVLRSAATSQ
jgi:hypothetical protein